MALSKEQMIASIRGQLVAQNAEMLIQNLATVSVQLQERDERIAALEAEVTALKDGMDVAPPATT